MPNLRIITANVADTATSLAASPTAGSLVAANMLSDRKGQAHRSTGTSVTYALTWEAPQSIGAVVLPATNLTAAATIRVRLYSDTAGSTQIYDSTAVAACPGVDHSWYGATVTASAFAYGALSKTAVWLPAHYNARRCVINLADAGNPAGFIDCARLVIGPWWEPSRNASYGAQAQLVDSSTTERTEAGDLVADRGPVYETLSFDLKSVSESDRATLMQLLRRFGTSRNFLLALLPADTAPAAERDHMVYGKRAGSPFTRDLPTNYTHSIEMESW